MTKNTRFEVLNELMKEFAVIIWRRPPRPATLSSHRGDLELLFRDVAFPLSLLTLGDVGVVRRRTRRERKYDGSSELPKSRETQRQSALLWDETASRFNLLATRNANRTVRLVNLSNAGMVPLSIDRLIKYSKVIERNDLHLRFVCLS